MSAARGVDAVDHRGERGRLPGTGRAGDENESTSFLGNPLDDRGKTELRHALVVIGNNAQHDTDRAALLKDVGAKTAQA